MLKKGKHFACICLFSSGFSYIRLGRVFRHLFQIRRNENYYVHGKMFATINFVSQKGFFILNNENKIAFYFKKGCFIGRQNQRFCLKKGYFSRPESAKRGCFSSLGTSVVNALVGSGGAGLKLRLSFSHLGGFKCCKNTCHILWINFVHFRFWLVSTQEGCCVTCQIWPWYSISGSPVFCWIKKKWKNNGMKDICSSHGLLLVDLTGYMIG